FRRSKKFPNTNIPATLFDAFDNPALSYALPPWERRAGPIRFGRSLFQWQSATTFLATTSYPLNQPSHTF
ncbi:MAG: hypothetical protein J5I90_18965, partial [Caldilineales bacterium]|nr:hypothetical protein [Caldilineales bacterium]